MPDRSEASGRIADVLEAIERIEQFTAGYEAATFAGAPVVRDAVVWNLAVIGEAAGALPDDLRETYDDVPWSRMRGLRNLLVHEYFGIDDDIVWRTVTDDVLPLAPRLRALRIELDAD